MEKIKIDMNFDSARAQVEPVTYKCEKCRDTGWIKTDRGVILCECRKAAQRSRMCGLCGITPVLVDKSFDNFDLSYYDAYEKNEHGISFRAQAEKIFNICQKYAVDFSVPETVRGLVLQGEVGRGKTHLAAACCNALIDRGFSPYFVVVPEFLDAIRSTYGSKGEFDESDVMDKALNAEFLVLDDLGCHNFTEWTVGKLFTLINYRVNHGLPMLITTNLSITELEKMLGVRIISRIVEACDFYCIEAEGDIRMQKVLRENGD